jgi:hypothetical protein
MANILLITPGTGVQNFDADELNSALEAVAAGGDLSPQQQAIANSLQGNVFAGGATATGAVQPVSREEPLIPLPQTLSSANSSGARDFRGFLAGLSAPTGGTASGKPLPGAPTTSGGVQGLINAQGLQSLFATPSNIQATPSTGAVASFADPDKIREVDELRLAVDKGNLEQERQNQILREQVRRGVIPAAARVTNQLGQPLVDLSKIGLTQAQVDATKPRVTAAQLLPSRQKSIIGAPRPRSIIGR